MYRKYAPWGYGRLRGRRSCILAGVLRYPNLNDVWIYGGGFLGISGIAEFCWVSLNFGERDRTDDQVLESDASRMGR